MEDDRCKPAPKQVEPVLEVAIDLAGVALQRSSERARDQCPRLEVDRVSEQPTDLSPSRVQKLLDREARLVHQSPPVQLSAMPSRRLEWQRAAHHKMTEQLGRIEAP